MYSEEKRKRSNNKGFSSVKKVNTAVISEIPATKKGNVSDICKNMCHACSHYASGDCMTSKAHSPKIYPKAFRSTPPGLNMNSRGYKPTEYQKDAIDPERVEQWRTDAVQPLAGVGAIASPTVGLHPRLFMFIPYGDKGNHSFDFRRASFASPTHWTFPKSERSFCQEEVFSWQCNSRTKS